MTQQEWQALAELLNRLPMTQAERLWLQELINRELTKIKATESNAPPENPKE